MQPSETGFYYLACFESSFFYGCIILYSMATIHLVDCSPAGGHWGCFLLLANTNSAATNIFVQVLLEHLPHLLPLIMLYLMIQQLPARYTLCVPCCFLLLTVGDWGFLDSLVHGVTAMWGGQQRRSRSPWSTVSPQTVTPDSYEHLWDWHHHQKLQRHRAVDSQHISFTPLTGLYWGMGPGERTPTGLIRC